MSHNWIARNQMAGVKGRSGQKAEKPWVEALRMATNERNPATGIKRLRRIADKLVEMAEEGDLGAILEIGNRLDGKSVQQVNLADENGDSLAGSWVQAFEAAALRARSNAALLPSGEVAQLPPLIQLEGADFGTEPVISGEESGNRGLSD